jgi:phage terminase Nu1 subunit (DNA packaging protein)
MTIDDSELMSRDQVARALDVTGRTLTRYAQRDDDPLVPARPGGPQQAAGYDPRDVVEWAIRRELEKLQQAAGHDEAIDYAHERARLTRAQADREELRVRELRRELADVRLVSYAIANFGSQARAILETLPGKIKRLQPKLTASDIEQVKREIVKIQNAAADITIDWSEAPEVD